MKKIFSILAVLFLALGIGKAQQASYQIGLTGSVLGPNNAPFTGTLVLQLTKSSVVNTCVTPYQVVPNGNITFSVKNGTIINGTTALLTSQDCLSPRVPYYVQFLDQSGKLLAADNWYLPQQPSNLGARLIDVGTLQAEYFNGPVQVSIPQGIVAAPTGSQTITQPTGTSLTVNNLIVSNTMSFNSGFSTTTGTFSGAVSVGGVLTANNGFTANTGTFSGLASLNGGLSSTTATLTGALTGPTVDGLVFADAMTGADTGAKINAAVSYCQTNLSQPCTIYVQASGTISTPPVLPMGYTLVFNPQGVFTLATNWQIAHRGISVYANHAKFNYTLDNGTPAVYIGKGVAATVNISGSTVTYVSGTNFSTVDPGDQICWTGPNCANIASATSTTLTLTGSVGTATGVSAMIGIIPNFGLALPNTGAGPMVQDLDIVGSGSQTNINDVGVEVEGVSGAVIRGLTVTDIFPGRCLNIFGSLAGHYYDIHCNVNAGGVQLDQNFTGPFVTGSNANTIYGLTLYGGGTSNWNGLTIENSSNGNDIDGLYVEGTSFGVTAFIGASGNRIHIADWERNTPTGSFDMDIVGGTASTILGPAQFQSNSNIQGITINSSTGVTIRDIGIGGNYGVAAINVFAGSSVKLQNVTNISSGGFVGAGTYIIEDAAGNYTNNSTTSGTFFSTSTKTTVNGTTTGTAVWSMPQQGTAIKQAIVYLNAYENTTGTAQTITLPASFGTVGYVTTDGGSCTGVSIAGATVTLPSSMGATQTGLCEVRGY